MSKRKRHQAVSPDYWQMSLRQWRSFPVLFAFALGMIIMSFMPWPINIGLFYMALIVLSYGLAHIATSFLARRRGQDQATSGHPPRLTKAGATRRRGSVG